MHAVAGVEQDGGAVAADGAVVVPAQVGQIALHAQLRDLELLLQSGEERCAVGLGGRPAMGSHAAAHRRQRGQDLRVVVHHRTVLENGKIVGIARDRPGRRTPQRLALHDETVE